jgi:hypothetical protein
MAQPVETDPTGRQLALAIAVGRIAIGAGALFATRPALGLLGFAEAGVTGRALAKLVGGRDIALGALVLAAREDANALRMATLAGAAVDAADAVAFGLAIGDPRLRRAGILGVLSGSAATVAGVSAYARVRDG